MDTTHSPRRAVLLAAVLFSLIPVKTTLSLAQGETLWTPQNTRVLITGPMRFNLAFANQTGQATSAIVSSLSPTALDGMPTGLAAAAKSPLLNWSQSNTGYFDAMWSSIRGQVCTDITNAITTQVNQSPNTAYDVQPCHMNTRGGMLVRFETNWAGSDPLQPSGSGRRLYIDYEVPLNGALFYVTSPHTCHHGGPPCPTEPSDPAFTLAFTVDLVVTCTSQAPANVQTIPLPVACTADSHITPDAVFGGDVTGQLDAAAMGWIKQLVAESGSVVASGGSSLPAAAAAAIAGAVNVAIKGIGAAVAAVTDQHLRDFVSSSLTILASQTAGANAAHASADFQNLFQDLYTSQLAGLKPFAVEIGPKWSLDFILVYPPPAKPVLQNVTHTQNKGSIISPSISVMESPVEAGANVPIKASNFRGTYINQLDIGWNKTVLGKPTSKLKWGPPEVTITTPALTFQATNLQPNTGYGFAVQECDALTCSPWSEILATKTEGVAAGDVRFWLDSNVAQAVGTESLASGGGDFTTTIKIPATTTPGQHMVNAGALGQPIATAPIQVCPAGGCGPSVALVNTATGGLYPNDWRVEVSYPVTLRGSQFTPGGAAAIYLDKVGGKSIGTAPVGPLGHFQLTFNMPLVAQGSHNFIAVEGGQAAPIVPGHPLQNAIAKKEAAGKSIEASVTVLVQALAQ